MPVPVEAVSVGDAHPEVPINAHVFDLGDELLAIALNDIIEGYQVSRHHLKVTARHNLAILKLIDWSFVLRQDTGRCFSRACITFSSDGLRRCGLLLFSFQDLHLNRLWLASLLLTQFDQTSLYLSKSIVAGTFVGLIFLFKPVMLLDKLI